MKSSKSQIHAKYHRIPAIRFEDQQLTSFSGLLIFQLLFKHMNLKQRLKRCFSHLNVFPIFGHHLVVLLLIIHLLLGFRRLREVDYYRDDPLVLRLLGLRKIPDVSTISRTLSGMDLQSFDNMRGLSNSLVIEGLQRERFPRLTLDFDGSVLSTKGHAEGTAVGFKIGPLAIDFLPTLSFLDKLLQLCKSFKRNGCCEFDLVAVQHRKDILIEKCRIHPRFQYGSRQAGFGGLETIHHELRGAIGIMDIAWPVVQIEELAGLSHRAKQRVITARAFLGFVEADGRTLSMAFCRQY